MVVGRVGGVGAGFGAGKGKHAVNSKDMQERIISLLEQKGPMTLKELSQVTGESYHALAVIVGRMAKAGQLVKRPAREIVMEWGRYSPNQMMYMLPEQAKMYGRKLPAMRYKR